MTSDVQVFLYPEELDAIAPDALAAQILELGCDAASVALVYHRGRRVLPRQARISALTTTTTYFEPERSRYGELVPVGNAPPRSRESLLAFRAACGRAGLGFRAWIVALHQDALATAYPRAAARTLDGSPNGIGLCPSAPESVELVEGLVADVCAQFEPELVELEAALYPAWEPAYTITLALSPLSEQAQRLGAQCFCNACRDLLGDDADALARRTLTSAGAPFGAESRDAELEQALSVVRATGVARLMSAATRSAHAGGAQLRTFGSGPPQQAELQGLAGTRPADRLLLGCGQLRGDELVERFQSLRSVAGERAATASINWSPDRNMAADAERLAAAGAEGLALYNLSLVPDEGLAAFREAASSFRSAVAA